MLGPASKVLVAGGNTLIGAAILKALEGRKFSGLLNLQHGEPDLRDPVAVNAYFAQHKPDFVFMAAGRTGGIRANLDEPADLMLDNLLVSCHLIQAAHQHGVRKLLYLASSCSYPRDCAQPMRVDQLMHGPVEPSNEAYAMAKLTGLVLCKAYRKQHGDGFITAIPANAFGPEDDFDIHTSHVIPALIRRMHEAKVALAPTLEVWGTGAPLREFIYAEDLAEACLLAMDKYDADEPINLGTNEEISIRKLAEWVRDVVGFQGELVFDSSHPDGMPRKRLDSTALRSLGWQPRVPLKEALSRVYLAYVQSLAPSARGSS
jgi:GDP-L-fucose synthase